MVTGGPILRVDPPVPGPGDLVRLEVSLPEGWTLEGIELDRLDVPFHGLGPGRFAGRAAVGRQEPAGARPVKLRGRTSEGLPYETTPRIEVVPRKHKVESLRVADPLADPPRDALCRLLREADRQAGEVRSVARRSDLLPLPWTRPVDGRVSARFGAERVYNGRPGGPHLGLDLASPHGSPILAPCPGTVLSRREEYLGGTVVRLDHGDGWVSHYMHLDGSRVVPGTRLAAGDVLGTVGASGRATGAHLHFAVSWKGRFVDPAQVLGLAGEP